MNYPLISEYLDAIRSAEDNFDKLCGLRPVLDDNGNPIMSSGNFAVVFKMKDINTGKIYAVKCFTKEQDGRKEAYHQITNELELVQSTYLAKVEYYDRELFVDTQNSDDSEFPVLLMDWVDGITLDRYIRQHLNDTYALEMLAYNFSRLAMWLLPQPFAHGDLKPDNILVHDDGSLTLVDYDGMFVPAMQDQNSRELGSPDFRHPLRTESDFNEHIDDFPAISILLSLRLIAVAPFLLSKYGAADRLLFTESDYSALSSCQLLKSIFPSQYADINTLIGLFAIAWAHKGLTQVSFRLLTIEKPKKEEILTKATKEDFANAEDDEAGGIYSKDGNKLLRGKDSIEMVVIDKYKIRNGTKIICNYAFAGCAFLKELEIPASIKIIGSNPLIECKCIIRNKSSYFQTKGNVLYNSNMSVLISFVSEQISFTIPSEVSTIGNAAFYGCKSLQQIKISQSVITIEDYAFCFCQSLQQINIPVSVNKIGKNPFAGCQCLIENQSPYYVVKDNVLYNSDMSVLISFLSRQTNFSIPQGVKVIGDLAFYEYNSLQQLNIPQSVEAIGSENFMRCDSLQIINIPKGSKAKFEQLLPEYKDKLVEMSNI